MRRTYLSALLIISLIWFSLTAAAEQDRDRTVTPREVLDAASNKTVRISKLHIEGDLDESSARRVLRSRTKAFASCFQQDERPTADLFLRVNPAGRVFNARVLGSVGTPKLRRCLSQVGLRLRFPRSKTGSSSAVTATLTRSLSTLLLGTLSKSTDALQDVFSGDASLGSIDDAFKNVEGVATESELARRGDSPGEGGRAKLSEPPSAPIGGGAKSSNQPHRTHGLVIFESPTVSQGLTRAHVDPVITRTKALFRDCYERRLLHNPRLRGRVVLRFSILPDGRVGTTEVIMTSIGDNVLHQCLNRTIRRRRFPAPTNDQTVTVSQPLNFRPAPSKG